MVVAQLVQVRLGGGQVGVGQGRGRVEVEVVAGVQRGESQQSLVAGG